MRLRRSAMLLLLLLPLLPLLPQASPTSAEPACFPEAAPVISACIDEPFRSYWEQHGGLPVFGYPLSNPVEQPTDHGNITMQLFERARLEYHPQNAPPYHVLLGHLGREATGLTVPSDSPEEPRDGCRFFAETGLNVCPPFLQTWQSYGLDLGEPGISDAESLALFGVPITPLQPMGLVDGRTIIVQWFERARFEDHGMHGVMLGLLGQETGLGGNAHTPPPWHNPYGAQEPGGFIEVAGSNLVRLGQPIRMKGVNYYPQWRPWDEMWSEWDAVQMERELRLARDQLGINAVRILLPYDAAGDGQVNERLLQRLREFLQIAGNLDMRVLIALFDFYEGFPQPGTRSERKNLEYVEKVVGNFIGDERIFAWDLHNEPDHYEKWMAGKSHEVLTWLGRMADAIHRIDPYHPVTVGMAQYENLVIPGPDGRRVIDYSDVISVHIYNAADVARQLDELRRHTDKPILLQEFGWPTGPPCSEQDYTEAHQEWVYREMLAAAEGRVAGVFAWTLRDYDAGPTMRWDTREDYYGLYRPDDSLKPAALVFREFAAPPLPPITITHYDLTRGRSRSGDGEKAPVLVGNYYLKNWFRRAWDNLGGQGSLGMPLSNAFVRPEDGRVVQYFENVVLELYPDAIFEPDFDKLPQADQIMRVVRPRAIGSEYASGRSFPPPESTSTGGEGAFFPETGYSVRGQFWYFYANLLGPWRLGAAISPEMIEEVNGMMLAVQYFERGRLEFHPEYNVVLFSQLGRWSWNERCRALNQ